MSGPKSLTVGLENGEVQNPVLMDLLMSGRYDWCLLRPSYDGTDQGLTAFSYDLTGAVPLSKIIHADLTPERYANVLITIANAIRICTEENVSLETVLWEQSHVYFIGDNPAPHLIQVPVVTGPVVGTGLLTLISDMSHLDTASLGHPEWASSLESYLSAASEFDPRSYLAFVSELFPPQGPDASPTVDFVDEEPVTVAESARLEPVVDGVAPAVDEYDLETILKVPQNDPIPVEEEAGDQQSGMKRRPRHSDEALTGDDLNSIPEPPANKKVYRSGTVHVVQAPDYSPDDENPTDLFVPKSRYEVTRVRDGRQAICDSDMVTIGRSSAADIHMGGNTNVSRVHAEIHRLDNGGFEIRDRNSINGTRVGGQLLAPGTSGRVDDSGTFSLADSDFIIRRLE